MAADGTGRERPDRPEGVGPEGVAEPAQPAHDGPIEPGPEPDTSIAAEPDDPIVPA